MPPRSNRCPRGPSPLAALALSSALALAPSRGLADPPSSTRVAWARGEGADRCPDEGTMVERVRSIVGAAVGDAGPALVEGLVERREGRWVARIFTQDGTGARASTRELSDDAEACDGVATAAALAIALSLGPPARRAAPAPAQPREARAAPPAGPPRPPVERAAGAAIWLRALGVVGLLPELAPAVGISGEAFVRGRWRVLVGGLFAPEVQVYRLDTRFAFGLTALSASACFDVARGGRFALAGCAGVLVGAAHAVVFDLYPEAPGELFWAAATASARLTARVAGPLVAELGAAFVGVPVRARFHLSNENEVVFEQSPASAVGYLGLGLSFR